jgi:sugar phosphate isomerase/epimerase
MIRKDRMGVQTLMLEDRGDQSDFEALCRAIRGIQDAGFKTIELVPAQFGVHIGRDASSFLRSAFGSQERQQLRKILEPFHMITVHGSNVVIQIRHREGRAEEELWDPYVELLRFGRDIGAGLVTFHSFQPDPEKKPSEEEMAKAHIRFGRVAAEYSEKWNLLSGYELATTQAFFLKHGIVAAVGSQRFGFLVDVGHLALPCPDPSRVTPWVIDLMAKVTDPIFEIHAGGVHRTSSGLKEHRPLDDQNILDHKAIMDLLRSKKFDGAVIFEIFFQSAVPEQVKLPFQANLDVCLKAKEKVLSF